MTYVSVLVLRDLYLNSTSVFPLIDPHQRQRQIPAMSSGPLSQTVFSTLCLAADFIYKRPCKCLSHLDFELRLISPRFSFLPALCLLILCTLLVRRGNQGRDEMLISLYKCTSPILLGDEEEECAASCWRAGMTAQSGRREEKRREKEREYSTWRECSDRQRKGSSIKRMMMQAHVKS